jgi:hypothetical protein
MKIVTPGSSEREADVSEEHIASVLGVKAKPADSYFLIAALKMGVNSYSETLGEKTA